MAKQIGIRKMVLADVTCIGCRLPATIDGDGLCVFCRREQPAAMASVGRQVAWRYMVMILLALIAAVIVVAGIFEAR